MAIDVEALKASVDMVAVIGNYTPLKRIGREYVGPCPIHNGDGDNFNVVPSKRLWMCWSHDCHGKAKEQRIGNDIIGFIQMVEGLDFRKSAEFLGAKKDWTPKAPIPHKAPPRPDRVTFKPPAGVELALEQMATKALGVPEIARAFRDLDGSLICYEARYKRGAEPEHPDKSASRMWTWGHRVGDAPGWGCGFPSGERPLYGLDRLGRMPDAQVVVFEGPKKADAGQEFFQNLACISWTGGAGAWHKHAWGPLAGRKVVLWPDADDTGVAACEKIADLLTDRRGEWKCQEVKVIDPFKAFK